LVIRRALNMQIEEDDVDQHQENIFHTRCHIRNRVCSMIIDGGSDKDQPNTKRNHANNSLEVLIGPITRARVIRSRQGQIRILM